MKPTIQIRIGHEVHDALERHLATRRLSGEPVPSKQEFCSAAVLAKIRDNEKRKANPVAAIKRGRRRP